MCGITGYFSFVNKINTNIYYEAHKKIAHRGPDDEGFVYKNKYGDMIFLKGDDTTCNNDLVHILDTDKSFFIMGHRRLSIIDLTPDGHQPFGYKNLYMVYNGEIYNYLELREELIQYGYRFETNTDTEVFLKAYHFWGIEAFNKFNGMWAAAIYDNEIDKIILTRDRFGVKPLYYTYIDNNLIFASEIKFLVSFMKDRKINEKAVYAYLRYSLLEYNNETFIQNIYSLQPGNYLFFNKNGISINKYYDISDIADIDIEKVLDKSIDIRLRSDVEIGALLSGGIDSSTIVCKLKSKKILDFNTFTVDFKQEKYSEKKYVDDVLALTGYSGHFISVDYKDIINSMEQIVYIHESPVRSMSIISQLKIYEYIRKHTNVKVVLNGQGADEIFSGYLNDHFHFLIHLFLGLKIKNFIKELIYLQRKLKISYFNLILKCFSIFVRNFLSINDKYKIFKKKIELNDRKLKYKNYFKSYLYNQVFFSPLCEYLKNEDRNSMYNSIESRLPYLDYNLVESAFSLCDEQYINNAKTKYCLREISKKYIPKSIASRNDKMGFVSPQEIWQRLELKKEFDKVFLDIYKNGLFSFLDNSRIFNIYESYQKGEFDDWSLIWRFYCLYYYKKVWQVHE